MVGRDQERGVHELLRQDVRGAPAVSAYDPFTPPSSDTSGVAESLPPARPTGVPKTFGVLSIVFASLMLCYSLLKVLAGGMVGAMGQMQNQLSELPQGAE